MKWFTQSGTNQDVAVSSRIRLARNLQDFPFPSNMTFEQKAEVCGLVTKAMTDSVSLGKISLRFKQVNIENLSKAEAFSLVEKHIISPEFAVGREGTLLLLDEDQSVSIMINEEDHIRIQVIRAGMDLAPALELANQIDDILDASLHYAFHEKLGYLTQCPTNLGTGLRASVMLHLPALQEKENIGQLASAVNKLGMTIRGLYGENTYPKGAFYQLSNQVTLGITEKNAMEGLSSVCAQVISQERAAREELAEIGNYLEDKIFRSLGILQNARILSAEEFMDLISNVRLGICLKKITHLSLGRINALIHDVQPSTLICRAKENQKTEVRDQTRAKIVRENLKNQII